MHIAAQVYANAVRKAVEEPGDLDWRAKQVRETIDSPGWKFIAGLLEDQREYLLTLVYPHGGVVPTQAEYAGVHGQIAGLDQALHVAEAVFQAAERADERERQLAAAGQEQR